MRSTRPLALLSLSLLLLAGALGPAPVRAAETARSSEIAQETQRSITAPQRFVNVWWLPAAYFVDSARELGFDADRIEEVRRVFADYTMFGVVDARLTGSGQPEFASIGDIVSRMEITRDGKPVEVLREVNPEVARLAPDLTYVLRTSLAMLGSGLRLLPIANVDPRGDSILHADQRADLRVELRLTPTGEPHVLRWHAPLTAVVGPRRCPEGGESLEAHWRFCPWHGVKSKRAKK